jgi:hypothetical protein
MKVPINATMPMFGQQPTPGTRATGEDFEPDMSSCEFAFTLSSLIDHENHLRAPSDCLSRLAAIAFCT